MDVSSGSWNINLTSSLTTLDHSNVLELPIWALLLPIHFIKRYDCSSLKLCGVASVAIGIPKISRATNRMLSLFSPYNFTAGTDTLREPDKSHSQIPNIETYLTFGACQPFYVAGSLLDCGRSVGLQ